MRVCIQAVQKLIFCVANQNRFLWLNAKVKFKRQPLHNERFINAGIVVTLNYLTLKISDYFLIAFSKILP